MQSYKDQECKTPHCVTSEYIVSHYSNCIDQQCTLCAPTRESIRNSLNSNAAIPVPDQQEDSQVEQSCKKLNTGSNVMTTNGKPASTITATKTTTRRTTADTKSSFSPSSSSTQINKKRKIITIDDDDDDTWSDSDINYKKRNTNTTTATSSTANYNNNNDDNDMDAEIKRKERDPAWRKRREKLSQRLRFYQELQGECFCLFQTRSCCHSQRYLS